VGARRDSEFTWVEGLAMCLGMVGVQLATQVIAQWGTFFYSPSEGVGRIIYVQIAMVGIIFVVGTIWDALTDPLIGVWSDRIGPRPGPWRILPIQGRRRPFIFWGSILLVFTSIGFWFPPIPHPSNVNFVFGMVLLCLHWTVFTITVVPINALGPEIARSERARVRLGVWISVGMIAGLAMAIVLPGELIKVLDPARAEGGFSPAGYRRVAILFALIALVLLQLPVWFIRERYDAASAPAERPPLLRGFRDALHNRAFIVYSIAFLFFNAGFLAAQNALPFWAELGLGGDEGTVTRLMIPFVLVCLMSIAFIPPLAKRLRTKWMMCLCFLILASGLPWMYVIPKLASTPAAGVTLGMILFGYCGMGQAILYVMTTPIMGEIIDYDEIRFGHRREALFNGLGNVAGKVAIAFAVLLSTNTMRIWGKSVEEPTGPLLVGPFGAVLALLGLVAFLFYPTLDVARKPKQSVTIDPD